MSELVRDSTAQIGAHSVSFSMCFPSVSGPCAFGKSHTSARRKTWLKVKKGPEILCLGPDSVPATIVFQDFRTRVLSFFSRRHSSILSVLFGLTACVPFCCVHFTAVNDGKVRSSLCVECSFFEKLDHVVEHVSL